jgi:methionyl-tRNA formyltransferase
MKTKYVFFGSPKFAQIVLEKLIKNDLVPLALVCNPDKPFGRKKIITPPDTKKLVLENNLAIKIFQPQTKEDLENIFKNDQDLAQISFGIVAAYSKIIPKSVIETFPKGIIGVHPSLLPKYRGPSPIQSAILDGQTESGVTLYLLDEKMDHGPIIAQESIEISDFSLNFVKLTEILANLAADLLIKTIPLFIEGKITLHPQDEHQATYTKKFVTQDGYVDLKNDDPELISRKIRALNPDPGVYTEINGKRIKLLEIEKNKNGQWIITKIQPEGKKPSPAQLKIEFNQK